MPTYISKLPKEQIRIVKMQIKYSPFPLEWGRRTVVYINRDNVIRRWPWYGWIYYIIGVDGVATYSPDVHGFCDYTIDLLEKKVRTHIKWTGDPTS